MESSRIQIVDGGRLDYDGSQIKPLWAFRELGVQGDSIVHFTGAMKVGRDELVDIKDLREGKEDFPISSEEALHFIVEHFDDPSLRLAYHRQRILVNVAKERIIDAGGVHVKRRASDLYVGGRKLSVSVATASASSSKIHLGLNITSKGVPEGVRATGLEEIGVKDTESLAKGISEAYVSEIAEIEEDITKTRVF
ncbi:MAG: DUF366 family protein [Methanobacteriota archaeon]|nr:MAG: DUF366 family protein [Euryarchaeota archaeon]